MPYQEINGVPVFGDPQENAVEQIANCAREAEHAVLMADHHLGYAVPIGGVVAYDGRISPSGVGYDIACGNKAVRLDADGDEVRKNIKTIMDDVWRALSFGVGRKSRGRRAANGIVRGCFEREMNMDLQGSMAGSASLLSTLWTARRSLVGARSRP